MNIIEKPLSQRGASASRFIELPRNKRFDMYAWLDTVNKFDDLPEWVQSALVDAEQKMVDYEQSTK